MNATPTFEMLDPATLTVDINVRKDAALTPDFVASIREHGVMEPVIAHRRDDGIVHVLMGQRRTRAAVEAGREAIPVMIIDSPEEAERIVTQVVENIQRAELTEADEADAYHQLSLIGVSAATIAKKTGRTKTTVESALKAKSTDTGAAALGKGYTVEAALILAEFGADEDAVEELESVIRDEPDMLAHVTQQLRDRRDRAAALAAVTAELEAAGTTVVESAGYDGDSENVRVSSLNRADGEPATEEDANAVHVVTSYNGTHSTVPVVAGWKELGFTLRYSGYGASSANKGSMTEEQKAERKTLIENNKLMQSATVVRRAFVKTLLAKKQPPKGWQHFTVHAITHHPETASGYEGVVAAEMAGAKAGEASDRWGWNPLRDHVATSAARPEVSLIALVCAGYEKTIAKDSWRSPSVRHIDYLTRLITWGYVDRTKSVSFWTANGRWSHGYGCAES